VQVRRKCETGAYGGPEDFAADMRRVFANAHTYNKAGTDVYVMATTLAVRRWLCRPGDPYLEGVPLSWLRVSRQRAA